MAMFDLHAHANSILAVVVIVVFLLPLANDLLEFTFGLCSVFCMLTNN